MLRHDGTDRTPCKLATRAAYHPARADFFPDEVIKAERGQQSYMLETAGQCTHSFSISLILSTIVLMSGGPL